MQVSVLGATAVWRDGLRVDLGTRKRRALVAALALAGGRPVSTDVLVDQLWAGDPPGGVTGTLQAYVSSLRRVLEPDRAPRAEASMLVTVPPGYALRLPDDALDANRFEREVTAAHRRLHEADGAWAGPALGSEELLDTTSRLDAALGLWHGTPYAELGDATAVLPERARLEELRLVALEDRARAALALGDHGAVAAELEALAAAHPLRERLWGLRALALARGGRQAEALAVLRELRDVLDAELGLEPSAELRDLQTALLRQDAAVLRPREQVATAAAPPASPAARRDVERFRPVVPPWPMAGRDHQLAGLVDALSAADAGTPSFATITGEPGIGKSRLCAELGAVAVRSGARLLVGRCSQDDGAPPLWPWRQVLRWLGSDVEPGEAEDEGAEFRTWEAIVSRVAEAAREETLVVVLDDLHWADDPTLRVLRLLLESLEAGRLLVIGTWRTHPEPTGALADVAAAFSRRHASRLRLEGLGPEQAAEVVAAVSEVAPDQQQTALLTSRTDGNPFFLVEYARLAHQRGDLAALMAEADPPTAVSDVLDRRLALLPEETRDVLRWAGVVGRFFESDVLARVVGIEEDPLLDLLEPAVEAGLVREDDVGSFRFGHALVRDQIYAAWRPTRRARAHARVASVLSELPDRESEAARHWLASGPANAGRAWRAARDAAAVARRVHAHGTAAELLDAALGCQSQDRGATARDRYDLLAELVEAHRWRGSWSELLAVVEDLIAAAREIGDIELLARAATATTTGAMWVSPAHGVTHHEVVAALREALSGLPAADGELRCRAMVALANEIYYGGSTAERTALVEEALAMARRLGDESLLLDVCQVGSVSLWRAANADQRLALAEEAMALAERLGDEHALVVGATLVAVVLGELGDLGRMWEVAALARRHAERLHLNYALVVLDTLELPWLAMAGRFDECEARLGRVGAVASQIQMPQLRDALAGALVTLRLWEGRTQEVAPVLYEIEGGPMPATSTLLVFLLRGGREDEARAHATTHPVDLTADDWFSMLNWSCAAEAALGLGDRDLAAAAYERLAPYAGRVASAGSGNAMGPVDAFLAHAAAAVGDLDLAAGHADAALRLMEAWQIPLAAQWLHRQRDRYGF